MGFHEAARGVLSHHMVIEDGKIANYQPYPPTPWNASPRDVYGTPGPLRGRGAEHADLRGERPGELQGDRHHAGGPLVRPVPAVRRAHVRGKGPVRKVVHTPTALCVAAMEPERADRPCPGAHGPSSRTLDDPACRALAEELARAVVQMYGAGLERIVELADAEIARRAGRGRPRGEPAADPRPLSGADRGARACRRWTRSALHGVPRRRRGAARDRGRHCQAAPRGQLQVVPGLVVDARAGGRQALEEAAPDLDGMDVEGSWRTRRRPMISGVPLPIVQVNGARRRGTTLEHRRSSELLVATDVRRAPLVVANVEGTLLAYRNSCARLRRRRSTAGALDGGALGAPAAGAATSCRRPDARWTTSTSSSSRCRCCVSEAAIGSLCERHRRGSGEPPEGVDGLGAARPRAAQAADSGAGGRAGDRGRRALRPLPDQSCRRTTATCSTSTSARSSASCEACWALRSGDTEFRPVGQPHALAGGLRLPEEIWAQFRIPIGLAFFMYSSVTDCVVALYPSPAGATESELHFETWSRLAELNPVLERARARRRGADRQPDRRIRRPTRSPRSTAATCSWAWSSPRWEGISGGAGVERAIDGYFDDLKAAAL